MTWPIGSSERGNGSRDSATLRSVIAIATTPIGTLMRKIHCQPKPVVSAPPTSGPIANEPPIVAPQTAIAPARSLRLGIGGAEQRERDGEQDRRAEALHGAGGDERLDAPGGRAGDRGQR